MSGTTFTTAHRAFAITAALLALPLAAQDRPVLPEIDTSGSPNGIVVMPETVPDVFKIFDRYTKVVAPNGKPIHIVIEKGYTDRQAVYARKVLINHLTDVPGTKYGHDKSAIANSIADRNAVLALFYSTETLRSPTSRPFLRAVRTQDLREYETILEGTEGYMRPTNPTRDASYEEILHFVQAHGIEPAAPALSAALRDAFVEARAKNVYMLDYDNTFEYFICALEAYYDMWRHDPEGDGTREDEYIPISRVALEEHDPKAYEIIEHFFGPWWLYTAEIAEEFEGTFSLTWREGQTYTNKSQYLTRAALTGSVDSNLVGNDENNSLYGNDGDNEIAPGGGSDVVDGGMGTDTAVFRGAMAQYAVRRNGQQIIVEDLNFSRDGSNVLTGIEQLRFSDRTVTAAELH